MFVTLLCVAVLFVAFNNAASWRNILNGPPGLKKRLDSSYVVANHGGSCEVADPNVDELVTKATVSCTLTAGQTCGSDFLGADPNCDTTRLQAAVSNCTSNSCVCSTLTAAWNTYSFLKTSACAAQAISVASMADSYNCTTINPPALVWTVCGGNTNCNASKMCEPYPGCSLDSDCPKNQWCNTTGSGVHTCSSTYPGFGYPCTSDANCAESGLVCQNSKCSRPEAGKFCSSNNCAIGLYCTSNATCAPLKPIGSPCTNSDQCAGASISGSCTNGVCVAFNTGARGANCTDTYSCSGTDDCYNDRCTAFSALPNDPSGYCGKAISNQYVTVQTYKDHCGAQVDKLYSCLASVPSSVAYESACYSEYKCYVSCFQQNTLGNVGKAFSAEFGSCLIFDGQCGSGATLVLAFMLMFVALLF